MVGATGHKEFAVGVVEVEVASQLRRRRPRWRSDHSDALLLRSGEEINGHGAALSSDLRLINTHSRSDRVPWPTRAEISERDASPDPFLR